VVSTVTVQGGVEKLFSPGFGPLSAHPKASGNFLPRSMPGRSQGGCGLAQKLNAVRLRRLAGRLKEA
jgi:hypothetical protein